MNEMDDLSLFLYSFPLLKYKVLHTTVVVQPKYFNEETKTIELVIKCLKITRTHYAFTYNSL